MNQVRFKLRFFHRRAIQQVTSRLYVNPAGGLDRTILVAGAARSGTSWLEDLIASQVSSRVIFEPYNPIQVPEYQGFHYFQYMQPGAQHEAFYEYSRRVFTGDIHNRWIDRQNEQVFPQIRIIKEIRANLALKWIHDHFPEVRIIFLLRHPCAVVRSRMQLGWATDRDIAPFLAQADLVNDYLSDYLEIIHQAATDEEKHAVVWSISNMVPLKQLEPGDVKVVFYENLCARPELELSEIYQFSGITKIDYRAMARSVDLPSLTAKPTSAVLTGKDRITDWAEWLTPAQAERVMRIVKAFGLDYLYADSFMPVGSPLKN